MILARVQRDVEWRILDKQAKELGDSPDRGKQWEEIANGYLRLWTTYGKDACEAKRRPLFGQSNSGRDLSAAEFVNFRASV